MLRCVFRDKHFCFTPKREVSGPVAIIGILTPLPVEVLKGVGVLCPPSGLRKEGLY